jgi:CubicO group peptidase (beta-lactamase class C family)
MGRALLYLLLALAIGCGRSNDSQADESRAGQSAAAGQAISAADESEPAPSQAPSSFVDPHAVLSWPRAEPEDVDFSRAALQDLIEEAQRTDSSALLIARNGKIVVERYFRDEAGPVPVRSVTKSVVGLAIGMLIDEGKIAGIDEPLSRWFPEWNKGARAKVTLEHVLRQRSGLKHEKYDGTLARQRDRTAYVRALPLVASPGQEFSYNNEASQLLAGVVLAASGEEVDDYLRPRLFEPLGIKNWSWQRDDAGHALGSDGLALTGADLLQLGQLLLDNGLAGDRRLLSESWIKKMRQPIDEDHYGLLWWVTKSRHGSILHANGWLGQYLVIIPELNLVAVRLREGRTPLEEQENRMHGFGAFLGRVAGLVRSSPAQNL